MESEYISICEEDLPEGCGELKKVIITLQGVIKKLKEELHSTLHKLHKAERKSKKLRSQNDDLHEHNENLGRQLHKERKPPKLKEASVQTSDYSYNSNATETTYTNSSEIISVQETENVQTQNAVNAENNTDSMSVWREANEGVSIADSLKAAAEEALQETGVVYDDNSGMYYDYNTGYYFDPDRSLYYEPHSGTYYYYNAETQTYEFHSQVDLHQYAEQPSSQGGDQGARRREKRVKKSEKSEKKSEKSEKKSEKSDKKSSSRKRSNPEDESVDDDRAKSEKRSKKKRKTSEKEDDSADTSSKDKKHKKKHKEKKKGKKEKKEEKEEQKKGGEKCTKDSESNKDDRQTVTSKDDTQTVTSKDDIQTVTSRDDNQTETNKDDKQTVREDDKDIQNIELLDNEEQPEIAKTSENTDTAEQTENADVTEELQEETLAEEGEIEEDAEKTEMHTDSDKDSDQDSDKDSEMEEGELSDSSSSSEEDESSEEEEEEEVEEAPAEETSALYYPPSIRVMVTASDSLDIGTLFLVTLTGTTLGRDENLGHGILIPDEQISKMHAAITYNEEQRRYTIKDHASQNGTSVNDNRISESKVMSDPWTLSNMDVVRIGGTTLKLHIHPGQETCDDCEPGVVKAKLQLEQPKETLMSCKKDKEKQRRTALNQIKKKYGLKEANYTDEGSRVKEGYEDKAAIRRKTKGIDTTFQKDEMPASVNRAIPTKNKGHQLLAKMGWKEGSGLGRDEQGRAEPVQAFMRSKQSAGLGSGASLHHSLDAQPQQIQQSQRWLKAQERFMALTGVGDDDEETAEEASAPKKTLSFLPEPTLDPKQLDPKQSSSLSSIASAKTGPKKTISFIQGQTLVQDQPQGDSDTKSNEPPT